MDVIPFLQVGLPIHNGRLKAQDVVFFTKHCARLAMRRSPEVVPSRRAGNGWLLTAWLLCFKSQANVEDGMGWDIKESIVRRAQKQATFFTNSQAICIRTCSRGSQTASMHASQGHLHDGPRIFVPGAYHSTYTVLFVMCGQPDSQGAGPKLGPVGAGSDFPKSPSHSSPGPSNDGSPPSCACRAAAVPVDCLSCLSCLFFLSCLSCLSCEALRDKSLAPRRRLRRSLGVGIPTAWPSLWPCLHGRSLPCSPTLGGGSSSWQRACVGLGWVF